MVEDINVGTFQKIQNEYKRQQLWVLEFDNIDAWTAQTSGRPTLALGDSLKINFVNTYAKFQQGRGTWNPITITLNDPIHDSAAGKLYEWVLTQWNYKTAVSAYKSAYAKDFTIKLLAPDLSEASETWTLHNAFLSGNVDFNTKGLDYDSTDRLQITFTLDYDYATLNDD